MARHLTKPHKVGRCTVGVLFNIGSAWFGAHYSDYTRRWCVNLVPFLTVWIALPGGKHP